MVIVTIIVIGPTSPVQEYYEVMSSFHFKWTLSRQLYDLFTQPNYDRLRFADSLAFALVVHHRIKCNVSGYADFLRLSIGNYS